MIGDIHGVLDRIGLRLGRNYELKSLDQQGFEWMAEGRRAAVMLDGQQVGVFGVVSLEVLKEYKIPFPISIFEILL